MIIFF
jgi:hypothetical protein